MILVATVLQYQRADCEQMRDVWHVSAFAALAMMGTAGEHQGMVKPIGQQLFLRRTLSASVFNWG